MAPIRRNREEWLKIPMAQIPNGSNSRGSTRGCSRSSHLPWATTTSPRFFSGSNGALNLVVQRIHVLYAVLLVHKCVFLSPLVQTDAPAPRICRRQRLRLPGLRAFEVKVEGKRLPVFPFSGFDLYHHFRNDAFYGLYNLLKVRKTGKQEVVFLQPLPQTL